MTKEVKIDDQLVDADTSEKIRDVISFVHSRTLSVGVYSPGDISVTNMYEEAASDLAEIIQQEIARVRLNEAQILYEDAINSTSHGHITYARKRVERHLETLKEHKDEL